MTSGDLVNEVTVPKVYRKHISTLLQLLWKFRKPKYTEWWCISKNVLFRHKNWHKSAIFKFLKFLKWRASMGHIGLSSCQVSRKSIRQFLRSDPGRTHGRTDERTEPILKFHLKRDSELLSYWIHTIVRNALHLSNFMLLWNLHLYYTV